MTDTEFISIAVELDRAGLIWHPEIGDEVSDRKDPEHIFILVDPYGLTPSELRSTYLWLPTVEQLIGQLEARQAMMYHAGLNESFAYEAVVKTIDGVVETAATTLRLALGKALHAILKETPTGAVH